MTGPTPIESFIVLPAVDIKGGKCVRLYKGDPDETTVFEDDPVEAALRWEAEGARMLHVVDLDGAFAGEPVNHEVIKRMAGALAIPIEVGGGVRDTDAARRYLEAGVERLVVGTRAFTDPPWLRDMAEMLGDRLVVGLDVRQGHVAVAGWTGDTGLTPGRGLRMLEEAGVRRILYTDTSRDGTLEGPNVDGIVKIARAAHIPVIASGGIGIVNDVVRLWNMRSVGIEGVIVGMALYTGKVTLVDIMSALEEGAEG